jgi:putative ABC transport system permease protein
LDLPTVQSVHPIYLDYTSWRNPVTGRRRRKIKVGGLLTLGTSFGADGNLITSEVNFLRIFNNRQKGLINIGVIKLKC